MSFASNFSFTYWVALRYLWSTRKDAAIWIISVFSILGVAIGVIVLNITMAIFSGFQEEFRDRIIGNEPHILVRSYDGLIKDWQSVSKVISKVSGVSSVSPYTNSQALLKVYNRTAGLIIKGISADTPAVEQIKKYTGQETIDKLFSPPEVEQRDANGELSYAKLPGILVGRELLNSLSVPINSAVSLLSPEVNSTPFGLLPKTRRFTLIGSYHSGISEYESNVAYIDLESAQQLFSLAGGITGFEVRVTDIDSSQLTTGRILDSLGGVSKGYVVQDWTSSNKPFFEALKLEKRVYSLVLLLIIVMASFSIVSSLIMVVLEKQRDIAIFRSLGASGSTIKAIFRMQGTVIGLVGVILGLLGSLLGCLFLKSYGFPLDERIFQMSELPIRIHPENFIFSGLAALLICFLATIYPAKRASALHPTDILRHE